MTTKLREFFPNIPQGANLTEVSEFQASPDINIIGAAISSDGPAVLYEETIGDTDEAKTYRILAAYVGAEFTDEHAGRNPIDATKSPVGSASALAFYLLP